MKNKEELIVNEKVKSKEQIIKEEIQHFQEYLPIIRRSIGWSTDDLAEAIGSKRQTINNLESDPPRAKLSYERYRLIRMMLSREIENNPNETEILKALLTVCVDKYDESTNEMRESIIEKAKIMIPTIETKEVDKVTTNSVWKQILPTLIPAVASFAAGVLVGAINYDSFGWLNNSTSKAASKAVTSATNQNKK